MDVFIKKYWPEEDVWFYFHYKDGWVERQIELWPLRRIYSSRDQPLDSEGGVADQPYADDDFSPSDEITEAEFQREWSLKPKS